MLTLVAIALVIAWHEAGHLLAAKLLGIGVQELSVGVGLKVLGFRVGPTRFALRLLPLGGYIDPADWNDVKGASALEPVERNMVRDRRQWLSSQPVLERIALALSGPFFNLAAAAILLCMAGLPSGSEASLSRLVAVVWDAGAREAVLGFSQGKSVHSLDFVSGASQAYALGLGSFLRYLAVVNLGLGLLNLVPIAPLDGGQVIKETVFEIHHGHLHGKAKRRAQIRAMRIYVCFALAGLIVILGVQCIRW